MNAPRRRHQGAITIMYALMLPALIACCGLALDAGLFYLRKTQLQNAADAIALAAARSLNGSAAGVTAAKASARDTAAKLTIGFGRTLLWESSALRLAGAPDTPEAGWVAADSAAAGMRYVRIDMGALDSSMHTLSPVLMGIVGAGNAVSLATVAVAGPTALQVTPLAICALSTTPSATRVHPGYPVGATAVSELVRYGFRYGVGYNLVKLNPGGTDPEYFLVDPVRGPGTAAPRAFDDASVAPFFCSGSVTYSQIGNGKLNLRRPATFTMWQQLNSRFGSYGGTLACNQAVAPPDLNVRDYSGANASWLNDAPTSPTAKSSTAAGKLRTIADEPASLPASLPGEYGIRWAFGPGRTPAGVNLVPVNFPTMYPSSPSGSIKSLIYPSAGPYLTAGYGSAPLSPGRANRRLLHIPLVQCPVAAGALAQANVLAIARFLLTAPASATEVPGEFTGIMNEAQITATTGLYR